MKKPASGVWVWRIVRPDVWRIVLLAVLSGLISFCSVFFALLSRRVVDIATGDATGNLWLHGGGLLALLAFQCGLNVLNNYVHVWVSCRIEMGVKQRVFGRLFQKHWREVKGYHSGDLVNRLTGDTQVVVNGAVSIVPRLVSMITQLIACVAVMLVIDRLFTLIMVAFGLVMLAVSRLYGRRMKVLHKTCQETEGHARSLMQEGLENWMVVRSFGGEQATVNRLKTLLGKNFAARLRRSRWSNLSHAALYLLFSGSYYVALLWGALRLAAGVISFGDLTAFLQIVSQIRSPFMSMSGVLPQYYNMLASAERLMELEDLADEPAPALPMPAGDLYSRMECLQVREVSFAYEDTHPVLVDVNLTVNKGEFVALAGFSGIGKSTLFKLLLGFITPDRGELTVEAAGFSLPVGASTRQLFAYVPQQNMLLSGTIRENIAFCREDADEDALWAAAEAADAAALIRSLPQGMDTPLGERGVGLSEGQLQRLAIARAVLSGAPVLLLDEATSALDEATEERVLRRLRALPGRTGLCISHRPAALAACHRVVRIVEGHLVEDSL